MSKQTIVKRIEATICDFCDKEIDTKGGDYCYHHLRSSGKVLNSKEYNVLHYLFSWTRPKKDGATEYVQYDFHAGCFDTIMQKFLKVKNESKRNKKTS